MKSRARLLFLTLPIGLLLFSGCTTDPVFQQRSVLVAATALPVLDASEGHYELWFSYPDDAGGKANGVSHGDAEFVSMGTFVVDSSGTMRGLDGGIPAFAIPEGYNPNLLIDAILTVESPGDSDGSPSGRLLAGTFAGTASRGVATLTIGGSDAFGRAFDSINVNGEVRLLTPSTTTTQDEEQGIWFAGILNGPGLELRPHPINLDNEPWTYEAWLTGRQGGETEYISLGTFDNPGAKDVNSAGPNAGPDAVSLNVPGEDFVVGTVRTLNDGTYGVVVSLQPVGPNVRRPFYPLLRLDSIPAGVAANLLMPLDIATGMPMVEITVER